MTDDSQSRGERLQKVLAAAGVGSRRDCEDLIREGRVEVDRKVVTELGTRVDPARQEVRVDGETLRNSKRLYFAVNKPIGVVTTNEDPSGRPRVIDLVPTDQRVFAVGRLDRSSEGLILVTNDGEFANRITHPRYGVEKTYLVRVAGAPDQRQLDRLKKGVHLAEGFARAQSIVVKKQHGNSTDLIIVLSEGRNREIRRILARVGHKVLALKRIAVGNIKLGDLAPGAWRRLTHDEIKSLLHLAKEKRRRAKKEMPRARAGNASDDAMSGSPGEAGQYVQKQALLAQPLSLDDLLRDDLDEGPLTELATGKATDDGVGGMPTGTTTGGVIDYDDEFSAPPAKARPAQHHGRRPQGRERNRRRSFQGGSRPGVEGEPRESYGKKRGGKRVFGSREEGRGPAGEKAGKLRLRSKHKKRRPKTEIRDNVRRGKRRAKASDQQHGKAGRKRKGRR